MVLQGDTLESQKAGDTVMPQSMAEEADQKIVQADVQPCHAVADKGEKQKQPEQIPPNLQGLTEDIKYKLAQWQPMEIMPKMYDQDKYTRQVKYTDIKEGLKWFGQYVGESKLISVDMENHFNTTIPRFVLLGSLNSRVLIIKLKDPEDDKAEIPEELRVFFREHFLLGCSVREMLRVDFIPHFGLEVDDLSRRITQHKACPWENTRNNIRNRYGLKHVPTLLYSETYGCYSKADWEKYVKKYPHPHLNKAPKKRHPREVYDFKWPMTAVQRAYCRNDALGPFMHALVLALFDLSLDLFDLPMHRVPPSSLMAKIMLSAVVPLMEKAEGVNNVELETLMSEAQKRRNDPAVVPVLAAPGAAIPDLRDEEEAGEYDYSVANTEEDDFALATEMAEDLEGWKPSTEAAKRIKAELGKSREPSKTSPNSPPPRERTWRRTEGWTRTKPWNWK